MSRLRNPAPFARLSALQALVATAQRRELGTACTETDLRRREEALLADEFAEAEANLDAVYDGAKLCPVRLRLAAAIMEGGAEALAAGRERRLAAEETEELARAEWRTAHYRTSWFADQANRIRKQEADRRDEAAVRDALSLRLVAGRGVSAVWPVRKAKP